MNFARIHRHEQSFVSRPDACDRIERPLATSCKHSSRTETLLPVELFRRPLARSLWIWIVLSVMKAPELLLNPEPGQFPTDNIGERDLRLAQLG